MKICMTHYAFYPTTGGVESHLLDLCAALVEQGHDVLALVGPFSGRPDFEEIDGISIHRERLMDPEYIRDRKEKKGLNAEDVDPEILGEVRDMYRAYSREHGVDVIHGHNFHHFVPEHALALTELWEEGMPNILTVHEVWSEFICEDLLKRARWDFIITFCRHVTDGIAEQAPHLDNLEMIHPGVDTGWFSPENEDPKWSNKLGLGEEPVIIHPARMLPWKGVIYSVRAMKRIVQKYPGARLIVTDTEDIVDWIRELKGYKREVLSLVKELGLEDNIITQPFPYRELPWVYNSCDVVIYPTIGEEPFGLVPVEAMACGKPTVVTRSGGLVESVVDGETGFIIDKEDEAALADRIVRLLDDEHLASSMGRRGRERAVSVFSRERMAAETADLYRKAIEKHESEALPKEAAPETPA